MAQNKQVLLLAPPNHGAGELLAFVETSVRRGGISYQPDLELTCRYAGVKVGTSGTFDEPDFSNNTDPQEYENLRRNANSGVSDITIHKFEITRSKQNLFAKGTSTERFKLEVVEFPADLKELEKYTKTNGKVEAIIILWPAFIREATSGYNKGTEWVEYTIKLLSVLPRQIHTVVFALTHFDQAMLAVEASLGPKYLDSQGHAALNPNQTKQIIKNSVKNSSRLGMMMQTASNRAKNTYVIPTSLAGIIVGTNETNYYPSAEHQADSDYLFDYTDQSFLAKLAKRYRKEGARINDHAQWWVPIHIADPLLYVCLQEIHEHFYPVTQFLRRK